METKTCKKHSGQIGGLGTAYWYVNYILDVIPKVILKVMPEVMSKVMPSSQCDAQSDVLSQCDGQSDARSDVASQSDARSDVLPKVKFF